MAIHIDFDIDIQEVEHIKRNNTITRLLIELQNRLEKKQKETSDNNATKEFKKTLDILGSAYKDDIPKIVDSYQKEYHNFVTDKLPKAEEQYKKLLNWTDNHPGSVVRKAIKELKENSYDQEADRLKVQWEDAKNELKKFQSYNDQAQAKKNQAQEDFENDKKFKDLVTNWFKDLDDLYKKAEALIDTDNYRAQYAYRLEFKTILNNVRQLKKHEAHTQTSPATVKDPEWLKGELTKHLREYCQQSYEYFCLQNRLFELAEKEKRNRESYDKFKTTRRTEFLREIQDLEPTDDSKRETVSF